MHIYPESLQDIWGLQIYSYRNATHVPFMKLSGAQNPLTRARRWYAWTALIVVLTVSRGVGVGAVAKDSCTEVPLGKQSSII